MGDTELGLFEGRVNGQWRLLVPRTDLLLGRGVTV
jgi:hypothetical protein